MNWSRQLDLSEQESVRFRRVVFSLGCSYDEFVRVAVMQAMDEIEGTAHAVTQRP